MTDITKCSGDSCPLKENCFRYKAKDSCWQSYFVGTPIDENGKCEYFWSFNNLDFVQRVWND